MKNSFQIAIDGPVAAGKSTAAKKVAERLGFLYVDTGAMYRAVALEAKRLGVDWNDESEVTEMMNSLNLELVKPAEKELDGRLVTVLLDGEDVSWEIRSSEIAEGSSVVSTYPGVREVLVEMQRNIANGEDVVMEGRDIGTNVLPDAQLKIYMDAEVEERVKRKWEFMKKVGIETTLDEVREALLIRDDREMNRAIDPLKPAKDGWIYDTTNKSIDEVVVEIVNRVGEIKN